MERIRVVGGTPLRGTATVTGAKNSVLKLMAASLLAEGETTLHGVPGILDVDDMTLVLTRLGATVRHDGSTVAIDVPARPKTETDYDVVRRMRAAICVLGPLIARCGEAKVALPGGDNIGSRALDMHVAGLTRMGATLTNEHGYLIATAPRLTGTMISLDFPSVGATENLLMAGVLAKGTTVIDNAAREPEIEDLCRLLLEMGAQLGGVGTSTLEIEGVDELHPASHQTVPDRIVAGTLAVGAVMTQGDVTIEGCRPEHLQLVLDKLASTGAQIDVHGGSIRVSMTERPKAVDVVTLPYPGFPTDLQPQMMALAAISDGAAMITENIFEGRFMFVDELVRLGADVRTDGHHAVVRGKPKLSGAPVRATDVRAGAALVLAGLVADGVTEVADVFHIDRGYESFTEQLQALGAHLSRDPGLDVLH